MKAKGSNRLTTYLRLLALLTVLSVSVLSETPSQATPLAQRATPTLTPDPNPTNTQVVPPTNTSTPTVVATATPQPTATETISPQPTVAETVSPQPIATETVSPQPTVAKTATANPDRSEPGTSPDTPKPVCLSRVEGFVIDQDENTVPDLTVRLSGSGWSTTRTTDSNGFFNFDGLCAGDLIVAALVRDRAEAQSTVSVTGSPDSVAHTTLHLAPQVTNAPTLSPAVTLSPQAATPTRNPAGAPVSTVLPSMGHTAELPDAGSSLPPALFLAVCFGLLVLIVHAARRFLIHRS